MGIYQTNEYVTFATEFTSGGELKSGLTVSVKAYSPAYGGAAYGVTNGAATEIVAGAGIYQYKMTVGDFNAVAYCVFSTTDPTVDKKVIVVQAQIAPAWVQHLDQNISSLPSASSMGALVWGAHTNDGPLVQPNSFGQALANVARQDPGNPIASAVWGTTSDQYAGYEGTFGSLLANPTPPPVTTDPLANKVPGSYAPDTAGYAMSKLLSSNAQLTSLVGTTVASLPLRAIRRGDGYKVSEGRALTWTLTDLPSNLSFTGATTYVSVGGDTLLFRKSATHVYDPALRTLVITLELAHDDTDPLVPATGLNYDLETDFGNGDVVTWGQGKMMVVADVR